MSSEAWANIFSVVAGVSLIAMVVTLVVFGRNQKLWDSWGGNLRVLVFAFFLFFFVFGIFFGLSYGLNQRVLHWQLGLEVEPWKLADGKMSAQEKEIRETIRIETDALKKAQIAMATAIYNNEDRETIDNRTDKYLEQLRILTNLSKELEKCR